MKTILLIEDNEDDIFLIKAACEQSGIAHRLEVTRDGHAAIAYLQGTGSYANRLTYPAPNLILLDIKMPGMDGLELLRWVRARPQFTTLPIIMLTASKADGDLQLAYTLGLNSFLRKNDNLRDMAEEMRTVLQYWLGINIS